MPQPERTNILRIKVELGRQIYEGDLEVEAKVDTDPVGLNQALSEHPGRFAWWATLEVLARTQAEELERNRGTLHARLYSYYEVEMTSRRKDVKGERPTVDRIKSKVLVDPKYRALQERLAKAEEAQGLLTVARQTMQARKDVLLAIASNYRAERDAHMHDQMREIRERFRKPRVGAGQGGTA